LWHVLCSHVCYKTILPLCSATSNYDPGYVQVFAGLLVGAMLPCWLTINSVDHAAPVALHPCCLQRLSSPFCCCLQVSAGLLVGAMLLYWFSAMIMQSVDHVAPLVKHVVKPAAACRCLLACRLVPCFPTGSVL
jgi:hypothetical protein